MSDLRHGSGSNDEERRGIRFFHSSGKPIYRSSGAATAIRRTRKNCGVVPTNISDRAHFGPIKNGNRGSRTGKDFEAHRYRLFVSLERCINGALDSLKRLKLKSTARKAESVAKNQRRQKRSAVSS